RERPRGAAQEERLRPGNTLRPARCGRDDRDHGAGTRRSSGVVWPAERSPGAGRRTALEERAAAARCPRDRCLLLQHGGALPRLRAEDVEGRRRKVGRRCEKRRWVRMRRIALPDEMPHNGLGDAAMARARSTENVVVGHEIVRARLAARVVHWHVAVAVLLFLLTVPALRGP